MDGTPEASDLVQLDSGRLEIDDYRLEDLRAMLDLAREQKPLAREHRLPHTHSNRVLACVLSRGMIS